ncbi:MAG: YncE family protein, partial [Haloplanus sp.]
TGHWFATKIDVTTYRDERFSDQETFENDRLVAGELDLMVDWQQTYNGEPVDAFPDADGDDVQDPIRTRRELADEAGLPIDSPSVETAFRDQFANVPDDRPRPLIDLDDVKPGDSGEVTVSLHLFDNPGYLDMVGRLLENAEDGLTESEGDDPGENGGPPGELADEIRATLWYDEDGDNELDPGDSTLLRKRCGESSLGLFDVDDEGTVTNRRTINLGIGDDVEPWGLSFHDGGSRTVVTDMHKDSVVEVDADATEIVGDFHTNTSPRDAIVANGKLYIANTGKHAISDQGTTYDYTRPEGPGSITIYDLDTGAVIKTILLVFDDGNVDPATDTVEVTRTSGPRLLATDDSESRVFAALGGANELAIIDTGDDSVTATVDTEGTDPRDMTVAGDRVLVANFGSATVSVVDVSASPPTVIDTISVDQNPWSIVADETSDPPLAAVANWSGGVDGSEGTLGSVILITLDTLSVSETFPIDSTPDGGPWGIGKCGTPIIATNDGTDRTIIIVGGNITIAQEGELPWDVDCAPESGESLGSDRVGVPYGGADIDFREVHKEATVTDGVVRWTVTLAGDPRVEEVPHVPAVSPGDDDTYPVPEPVPVATLRGIERVIARGSLADVLGRLARTRGYPLDGDRLTVDRDPYPNSTTQYLGLQWELPVDHANEVQSDAVTFDLGFAAEQARHNDPDGALAAAPEELVGTATTGSGTVSAAASDEQVGIDVTETTGPRLMATDDDGTALFVALGGADELLILDTATDTVDARIDTGGTDPRDVAVVDDETVLVTNFGSGTVGVVDLGASPPTVTETIGVGENPWGIDTDGENAVVANWSGTDTRLGSVSIIDLSDLTETATITPESTTDGDPWGVATCPDRPIYVTNDGTDRTLKIDPDTADIETVDRGELPWDAGCSPDGTRVAVAYGGADITLREDGKQLYQRGEPIACDDVADEPIRWVVQRSGPVRRETVETDTGTLERERLGATDLAILDSATGDVLRTVNLGIGDDLEPWGVAWSPDSSRVYVTDMHKDSVIEVDAESGRRLHEFNSHTAPRDTAVANGKLYIANTGKHAISEKGTPYDYTGSVGPGSISVYDLATREIRKLLLVLPDDL